MKQISKEKEDKSWNFTVQQPKAFDFDNFGETPKEEKKVEEEKPNIDFDFGEKKAD